MDVEASLGCTSDLGPLSSGRPCSSSPDATDTEPVTAPAPTKRALSPFHDTVGAAREDQCAAPAALSTPSFPHHPQLGHN